MVAMMMFVMFMLIVAIVYLNLLVAMMTSGYTEVRTNHSMNGTYLHNNSSSEFPLYVVFVLI